MANSKKILVQDLSENCYGFVVLTAGIKLDRFKRSPVMLYMHDREKLIGKWKDLSVTGNEIHAEPVFNSKNVFAAEKEQEFEGGFLNGTSLGLKAMKWANGSEYGMAAETLVLAECELMEISMVTVGANPNTVRLYDSKEQPMTEDQVKDIHLSLGQQQPSHQSNKHTMDFKALLIATLNLKADASDADITAALQNLKNENVTLSADNKKLQDAQDAADAQRITDTIELAVKEGKITPELKPTYEALLKADFTNTKAALDGIKPAGTSAVNLAAEVNKTTNTSAAGTVELKTISDYHKAGKSAELAAMKKDKKQDFVALCAASGVPESEIDWNS